jgi:DNA-binding GntR family transcriptional regulator
MKCQQYAICILFSYGKYLYGWVLMLTLKQHAYQVIRKKLELGGISNGHRLSDNALANEIGISRGPVREAISQLASEGFVEYHPRRGAFVKLPDRREMEELYEVRIALEGFAAARAAQLATAEQIAELERLHQRLFDTVQECQQRPRQIADQDLTDRFLAADMQFHLQILHAADNRKLLSMVEDCKIFVHVFAHVPIQHDLRLMASSYQQHALFFEAIRRHDTEMARQCMTDHLSVTSRLVLDGYNGKAAEQQGSK